MDLSMMKGLSPMAVPPLHAAMMGEFLGTALLILLGDGVVAGDVLLNKASDKMMITTAWGLAVALAVYLCGRLSGGHINPAVTLALAVRGEFPRSRVLPYWGANWPAPSSAPCSSTPITPRPSGPSNTTSNWSAGRWRAASSSARRLAGRRVRDLSGLRRSPGGTSSANSWERPCCCWASAP